MSRSNDNNLPYYCFYVHRGRKVPHVMIIIMSNGYVLPNINVVSIRLCAVRHSHCVLRFRIHTCHRSCINRI